MVTVTMFKLHYARARVFRDYWVSRFRRIFFSNRSLSTGPLSFAHSPIELVDFAYLTAHSLLILALVGTPLVLANFRGARVSCLLLDPDDDLSLSHEK